MKHSFTLISLALFLIVKNASGQVDSTFSIVRNGVEAKFPYTKLTRPEQLKNISTSSLPLYSFSKTQFFRTKSLLINFVQIENDYRELLNNRDKQDSIRLSKEKTLTDGFKLQEERANNFQASYNSLLNVNSQLNDQLKKAEQLAVQEHKKKKLKSILFGALAFSTGIVIGMAVR